MSLDSDLQYAVVIPTIGRPSLATLLDSLASQDDPLPTQVVVVDDRPQPGAALELPQLAAERLPVRVLPGFGRGPAAARNLGWRVCLEEWVVFLDDDVELTPGWSAALARDLADRPADVGGVQAHLEVPAPKGRRPTDWERSTLGLTRSTWITADLAYRRAALDQAHGFDERFPRAYREDADLGARLTMAGWRIERGCRATRHPVRPQPGWAASLRQQRGNADDALLRHLLGRRWRDIARTGRGRLPWHLATVGAGWVAVAGAVGAAATSGPGRREAVRAAAAGAGAWAGLTAQFAWRRIAAGPRDGGEVLRMLTTSALIPPSAVWHRCRGAWAVRHASAWPPPVRGVLLDRDGTLVEDVPYNGDPAQVRAAPRAGHAVKLLRDNGIALGVVTNQSGVGRGLLTTEQVDSVNAEIEAQLGPFQTWQVCPHAPSDGCRCHKPAPGLIRRGARALGLDVTECVVVGDIGSDVLAARAAGARSILVPTEGTLPGEVADAPVVARDLVAAAELILEGTG